MITGPQIKAARTLLGWRIPDLTRRTGIDIADIQELETMAEKAGFKLTTVKSEDKESSEIKAS